MHVLYRSLFLHTDRYRYHKKSLNNTYSSFKTKTTTSIKDPRTNHCTLHKCPQTTTLATISTPLHNPCFNTLTSNTLTLAKLMLVLAYTHYASTLPPMNLKQNPTKPSVRANPIIFSLGNTHRIHPVAALPLS